MYEHDYAYDFDHPFSMRPDGCACPEEDGLPAFDDLLQMDMRRMARDAAPWHTPEPSRPAPPPAAPQGFLYAAQVDYTPPQWVLEPFFQRGHCTLIQGDSGVGKTAFLCAVAAHITTGRPILEHLAVAQPGPVLMLSVEDDPAVLRGRIEASGGDISRVGLMDITAAEMSFESPLLEQYIGFLRPALVVFDPFQAFLGAGIDMHRANQTRPILARLDALAARYGCAVAIAAHTAKVKEGRSAVNYSLGSVDIAAAMRSILHIGHDPAVPGRLAAIHVKSSNAPTGPSLHYTIGEKGRVNWAHTGTLTAADVPFLPAGGRREEEAEDDLLGNVLCALFEEHPEGGFFPYSAVLQRGKELYGSRVFEDGRSLKARLSGGLGRYLQARHGFTAVAGERGGKGVRGLKITPN